MSRQAVERLTGRMYKHHLESTGRLPTPSEKRAMEKKVQAVAERVENRKKRR